MATTNKRPKLDERSPYRVWLRLSDPFIRTDGNLISPIIKAETSIRVLFRLQEKTLVIILHKVYRETGLKTQDIKTFKSSNTDLQMNLFLQCVSTNIINEEKLNQFKERLIFHLSKNTSVKSILIDQVNNTEEIIPQPMISEPDFEIHKLELCYKALCRIQLDSEETGAVSFIRDSVKKMLHEFKEKHTKIAILSQNGKGKSFLLNLILLLTIDNEEEYRNNNKKLKLPKDIIGDPTIEELGESLNQLPDVVKDFIRSYQNTREKFKALMESTCIELHPADTHEIEQSQNMFLSLPGYFKEGGRIETQPYILAQKNLEHSYESTTKCIIHLRYGSVYQIKVDYFCSEDLKQQLFELVSLRKYDTAGVESDTGLNKHIKDKAYECLQTRFAILTDTNISDINEKVLQKLKTYSDIVLCKEVKQFAGRTELYIGSGKNSTEDRLALKAILQCLTSPQNKDSEKAKWDCRIAAVKEIVVYVPSKFLYGGKEILEMPGTDDSDALALDFINKALNMVDAVFVLSEFSFNIVEKEVKDILINSEFMQKWKKRPELSCLMLLAYPEKDAEFQFKIKDHKKIEKLTNTEVKKRSTEMKQLSKLFGMSLPQNLEAAVFTSYILPVLHTSIHAQEGTPHEVIHEHAGFLKFTGINKIMSHLDAFISSSRKMHFQQLQKSLKTEKTEGLLPEYSKEIIQMYQTRDVKAIRENELFRQYDRILCNLSRNLENVYTNKLDRQVADTFAGLIGEALLTWDLKKENIYSIGVFNPYYSGNNPTYKLKIAGIILNNTENLKSQIFAFLKEEIAQLLKTFKKDVINLFSQELKSVLEICGHRNIDSRDFVHQSIKDVLSDAQQWYIGKQKKPINEHTVGKYLKESKKVILKKYILLPAYNQSDLDLAKQLARKNIPIAVMALKEEMKTLLLKLHNTRWTSFCIHLKGKSIPKAWQVLLSKLKQNSRIIITQQQQPDEQLAMLKLITAAKPT
ncbi:uncharacterized protein [Phyllobates terribilis]|uniref:uncharacterized protein isoform X2 n=1 Tax=Phyllobates terribilis TaxID=111132 RepID=UPI003CCB0FBA